MTYKLDDHFTYKKLMLISLPAIMQMIFISIYGIVDGFFVSNYCGTTAFSGVNIVWPITNILSAFGFMMGTGGTALVAKTLGEGKKELACKIFSMIVIFNFLMGIVLSITGFFLIGHIAYALGARDELLDYATRYGRILIIFNAFFIMQSLFHSFFIVAEKPKLGFIATLCAGITNMFLDLLFVGILKLDVEGAAFATAISYIVGTLFAFFYFVFNKTNKLHLTFTKIEFKYISRAIVNGSSELVSNISMSIVSLLFDMQLLRYYGEAGVASYGIIMYVSFIFVAIFIGFVISISPIISYNYGAKNNEELKNVYGKAIPIVFVGGIIMTILIFSLATPLSYIFAHKDPELLKLSSHAMRIYAFTFMLGGITFFASAFFTALNNGLISAIISFVRVLVLEVGCVLIMPLIIGKEGIWFSTIASESIALIISLTFILKFKKKYNY